MENKQKSLKDEFSEKLRQEGEHSNWLETADAEELKNEIEKNFRELKLILI